MGDTRILEVSMGVDCSCIKVMCKAVAGVPWGEVQADARVVANTADAILIPVLGEAEREREREREKYRERADEERGRWRERKRDRERARLTAHLRQSMIYLSTDRSSSSSPAAVRGTDSAGSVEFQIQPVQEAMFFFINT